MSQKNFRRDLNRAFEAMSGPPSRALSAQVRSALSEQAAARPAPFWIAGLAAALIAAIVIGVLVVSSFNRNLTGGVPGTLPSTTPTWPIPQPLPPELSHGVFICSAMSGATQPTTTIAYIDGVLTETDAGFDRITIEFQNVQPGTIEVRPQGNSTFTQGASGQSVTLAGSAGLLVIIPQADAHTAYSGATDFKTNYPVLLEARQVEDFEGTVQWALGLSKPACYQALVLPNPTRLQIDIETP